MQENYAYRYNSFGNNYTAQWIEAIFLEYECYPVQHVLVLLIFSQNEIILK